MSANTKTFHGSCHCGAIRFEADIDLSAGTGQCNCTYCTKVRWWGTLVRPSAFRLVKGRREDMGDYSKSDYGHHRFCKTCGIQPFGDCNIPQIGGEFVSVNLHCLDDADLTGVTIQYQDGRNDTWATLGQSTYVSPFVRA